MKNSMHVVVFCLVLFLGVQAQAVENPVETIAKGCDKEMTTYCRDVTLGDGRGLACLYAYSDKLSAPCEHGLYDAAAQLQRALADLTYVANESRSERIPHSLLWG